MSKKLEVPEIKTGQDQNDESFAFELQYVTFKLDEQSYGVNVDAALEVIRMVALTESPELPDHVVGVINLRGQVVPIVDLRKRPPLASAVF
ncbi:MAG: chemotaxis protein CheW [Actinomycetia bacterium]|nr:chemotaxis protein CheW [Actinomycetes bacterium]